nr:hypothetical protein RTCK_00017 [Rhizobium sp. TCK]
MSFTISARAGSRFNCDSDTVAYLSVVSLGGMMVANAPLWLWFRNGIGLGCCFLAGNLTNGTKFHRPC